jgi:hypothetical protein
MGNYMEALNHTTKMVTFGAPEITIRVTKKVSLRFMTLAGN